MQRGTTPKQSRKWQACQRCELPRAQCGYITTRGYCLPCAESLSTQAAIELSRGSGELYERWVSGMLRFAQTITPSPDRHTTLSVR